MDYEYLLDIPEDGLKWIVDNLILQLPAYGKIQKVLRQGLLFAEGCSVDSLLEEEGFTLRFRKGDCDVASFQTTPKETFFELYDSDYLERFIDSLDNLQTKKVVKGWYLDRKHDESYILEPNPYSGPRIISKEITTTRSYTLPGCLFGQDIGKQVSQSDYEDGDLEMC
jgi:hypothetical protein